MRRRAFMGALGLFWLFVCAIGCIGWVWNIFKLAHMEMAATGMFALRCIGVFVPPIGAIMGFV